MDSQYFLSLAHRELKSALCEIKISINLVTSLPTVEEQYYLDQTHLSTSNCSRYWIPWTEDIGVWIDGDGQGVEIVLSQAFSDTNIESSLVNCMTAVVIGACLNLQGRIAIHANAVALSNKAAAFVGYSGRGKSTLTAYCLSCGAGFITDDVLNVDKFGNVNLGYPRVKLYPHTGEHLGIDATGETDYKLHYHPEKFGGKLQQKPLPLASIFFLEESDNKCIRSEQLSSSQAVFELLTHSYYASQLVSQKPSLLDAYISLVTQTPVKKLFYPREFTTLPEVYKFLLEEVN